MEFFDVVRARRSIRAYEKRDVEPEKLEKILACANAAPSAGNLQGYAILVVRDEAQRKALRRASLDQPQLTEAPVVLAFVRDAARSGRKYGRRGETLYSLQDATIACAYAQLAATALGLATCWIGAYDDAEVSRILGLSKGLVPVALLPVGYAAESPAPTPRRALDDLVKWGQS
ncbi:MAG: nitroreductase family protein [Planctomycetota bacterium]